MLGSRRTSRQLVHCQAARNRGPHGCRRRALRADSIKMFVLDEADEMLSRGFKDQIYDIFQLLPPKLQVSQPLAWSGSNMQAGPVLAVAMLAAKGLGMGRSSAGLALQCHCVSLGRALANLLAGCQVPWEVLGCSPVHAAASACGIALVLV